jgi:hypothetical protein
MNLYIFSVFSFSLLSFEFKIIINTVTAGWKTTNGEIIFTVENWKIVSSLSLIFFSFQLENKSVYIEFSLLSDVRKAFRQPHGRRQCFSGQYLACSQIVGRYGLHVKLVYSLTISIKCWYKLVKVTLSRNFLFYGF